MASNKNIFLGLSIFLMAGLMWLIASDASGLCNDTSRLATADALVNHGTFRTDKSVFLHLCDLVKMMGNFFFSDKPLFLSLFYALPFFIAGPCRFRTSETYTSYL